MVGDGDEGPRLCLFQPPTTYSPYPLRLNPPHPRWRNPFPCRAVLSPGCWASSALTLLGAAVLYSAPTKEKDKDYEMVRLVVDTLHEVRERYVTPIDEERERQLVSDMLKGGLERLDPHSTYIDPEEYKQFSKQRRANSAASASMSTPIRRTRTSSPSSAPCPARRPTRRASWPAT